MGNSICNKFIKYPHLQKVIRTRTYSRVVKAQSSYAMDPGSCPTPVNRKILLSAFVKLI